MIRIAIVEDDQAYARSLQKYIERYEQERQTRFALTWFPDGEEIVTPYKAEYDLILMDIEMPFMDGMTAAKKIREVDTEVVIIFITSNPQYVMRGYEVEALDFVVKPINYFAFSQKLERAIRRMGRRRERFLVITGRDGMVRLPLSEIYSLEVYDHEMVYHTARGDFSERRTIREVEEILGGDHFFRTGKGTLVNLAWVEGISGGTVRVAGRDLPVSRAKKKGLMDALNNYLNEVSL